MSVPTTPAPAQWVEDSFGGGAYFYETDRKSGIAYLCHAPKNVDGTYDWNFACQVERERCDPEVQVCIDKGIVDLRTLETPKWEWSIAARRGGRYVLWRYWSQKKDAIARTGKRGIEEAFAIVDDFGTLVMVAA